jgi:hypothetical protein
MSSKEILVKLDTKDLVTACSWCKKIRDPYGNWIDPGVSFSKYFTGKFTHTICGECCSLYFSDFFSKRIYELHQQVDTQDQ